MGDLLYFPDRSNDVREEFRNAIIYERDKLEFSGAAEFVASPWKRTMDEWAELMASDKELEKKLRRFRKAFSGV